MTKEWKDKFAILVGQERQVVTWIVAELVIFRVGEGLKYLQ